MSQSFDELQVALEDAPQRKSGRAVFDQGHTVWEWQTATGVFERYVSEEQMTRLEASGLQLVDPPSQEMGIAIYGSKRLARKDVSGAPVARSTRSEAGGAFRQLLRRLVTSI